MRLGRYVMVLGLAALIVFLTLTAPDNNKSIEELSTQVIGSDRIDEMDLKGQSELKRYYGIGRDDVDGFLLYGPVNSADVSEFLLLKVKDKSDMDDVRQAVEDRCTQRMDLFADAGGTQLQLLKEAQLKVRGKFLLYCVGDHAAGYAEAFVKSVKK